MTNRPCYRPATCVRGRDKRLRTEVTASTGRCLILTIAAGPDVGLLGKYLGRNCDRDARLLLKLLLRFLQLAPQVFVLLGQSLSVFYLLSQQLAHRLQVVPHLPGQVNGVSPAYQVTGEFGLGRIEAIQAEDNSACQWPFILCLASPQDRCVIQRIVSRARRDAVIPRLFGFEHDPAVVMRADCPTSDL